MQLDKIKVFFLPFHINQGDISKSFALTFIDCKDDAFNIFGEIYLYGNNFYQDNKDV